MLSIVLAAALMLMFACAPVPRAPELPGPPPPEPGPLWSSFQKDFAPRGNPPFWLKASLNFSTPEQSHRTVFEFWGNTGFPLRLDFKAGLGTTFALWRMDAQGWLGYYPRKETAYTHPGSSIALRRFGFPCPFSLQELALSFTGQWAGVVPDEYTRAVSKAEGKTAYHFRPGATIQTLVLDPKGRITSLSGKRPFSWSIHLDDYQQIEHIWIAHSYKLEAAGNRKAVVRLKDLRFRSKPWPAKALRLPLPEDTRILPLGGKPSSSARRSRND